MHAPTPTTARSWRDLLADLTRDLWRFWEGAAAEDRYPQAPPGPERVGRIMLAAATIWMALVAAWGIVGPFPDGHFAATANIGTAGWNMLTFHLRYPVLWTAAHAGPGAADSTYMHHPLGVFWTAEAFIALFGAHNWALRLPAVIASTLCPLLVYRIARAVWGPVEAGLGALAYVSLPITLGFSNFHALEGPVIVGLLAATWGYVRYLQTYRERWALLSLAGYLWALNNDWPAYFWMAVFGGLLFLRNFIVPPRFAGRLHYRAVGRYWAFLVGLTLASLLLIAYFTVDSGKVGDLYTAFTNRSSGNRIPLRKVLEARHVWIELMFPGLAIFLGKVGLVVVLARAVVRRSWNELMVPFPLFVMAAVQYAYFKQGADVHIFWPQYFAPYFALAIAATAASVRALAARAEPRLAAWAARWDVGGAAASARLGRLGPYAGALALALPLALVWRDGASMVRLARESGGRFNSSGIQSDVDKVIALRWYLARYPKTMPFGFHPSMTVHWGLAWEAENRPIVRGTPVGTRASHASRLYMLDTALAPLSDLREALANFRVTAVGNYWFLDRESPPGLEGWSFAEREPSLAAWYFEGGTEPTRTVVADPFVAWEWRNVLGEAGAPPNPPPAVPPRTLDQLRIAHNAALAAGDGAAAERLLGALRGRFDLPVTASWKNGTVLLGGVHDRGAQRRITLFFKAGTFAGRAKFSVTSKVQRRAFLSTLALDDTTIEIAQPPSPPTEVWRAGHVYAVKIPYFKRPGVERYTGRFVSLDRAPAPARADATGDVALVTVR
jgi:4-amino-4-deoxy-L-arabinose transferase-like glycosyltransferase